MKINNLIVSHSLIVILAALYLSESGYIYLSTLDDDIFFLLNSKLGTSKFWDYFFMLLNHRNERMITVFVMIGITFSSIFWAKDKAHQRIYLANSITAIIFLELFILINYLVFSVIFPVERLSPSLVHESFISLQDMFNSKNIKIASTRSFLGDHAFALTAWALLTLKFAPKKLLYVIVPMWAALSTARLFAGAHWFTDVLSGIFFSYFLFSYAAIHDVWYYIERKVLSLIKKFDSRKAAK